MKNEKSSKRRKSRNLIVIVTVISKTVISKIVLVKEMLNLI